MISEPIHLKQKQKTIGDIKLSFAKLATHV